YMLHYKVVLHKLNPAIILNNGGMNIHIFYLFVSINFGSTISYPLSRKPIIISSKAAFVHSRSCIKRFAPLLSSEAPFSPSKSTPETIAFVILSLSVYAGLKSNPYVQFIGTIPSDRKSVV